MNNSKLSKKFVKKFSLKLKNKKTRIHKKILKKMKGGEMITVHFETNKKYDKNDLLMTEYYYKYINGVKLNNTDTDVYFKLPLITSESLDTFLKFIKIPLHTLSITSNNNATPSYEDIMTGIKFKIDKQKAINNFLNQEYRKSSSPLTNKKNILNILYLVDFIGFSPTYDKVNSRKLINYLISFIQTNNILTDDLTDDLRDYEHLKIYLKK